MQGAKAYLALEGHHVSRSEAVKKSLNGHASQQRQHATSLPKDWIRECLGTKYEAWHRKTGFSC